MAIRFIFEIVLHLLQQAFNFVFGVDVPSLLFEVVVEIFKYFTLESQPSSTSDTEPLVPLEQLATISGSNSTPVVRSVMIYRICQAMDLSVKLAPFEETGDLQTPSRNVRKITPFHVIHSIIVFKMC
ncbi:hypothetical protein NPIL_502511 [Nephila pilipes]|uniref:Uncharacterized protein n=1 Tax=Nephila pilipes TaxID=299642 RepID=A0A8X6PCJ0_NEPPI|nr:hypothetical protein NPIL_502511 [Nephila pilipes]